MVNFSWSKRCSSRWGLTPHAKMNKMPGDRYSGKQCWLCPDCPIWVYFFPLCSRFSVRIIIINKVWRDRLRELELDILIDCNIIGIRPFTCWRFYVSREHYENMPIQIYWKFYHIKMKIFRWKMPIFFLIYAQNIDCGYSLEPPLTSTHNLCFWAEKKNNVYPCKSQFSYIKVGFKGVKTIYIVGMFVWWWGMCFPASLIKKQKEGLAFQVNNGDFIW